MDIHHNGRTDRTVDADVETGEDEGDDDGEDEDEDEEEISVKVNLNNNELTESKQSNLSTKGSYLHAGSEQEGGTKTTLQLLNTINEGSRLTSNEIKSRGK